MGVAAHEIVEAGDLEGGVCACGDSRNCLVEAPAVVVDELVDPGMHARRH